MAIAASDIKYRLSGGASNTDPLASLGGAISSTDASATIFDNVSSSEAVAGDTEYRCVYIKNNHATLTLSGVKLWIQANTPSSDTDIFLGVGTSAQGGTEQTVADENTAPTSVTFSQPTNFAGGLAIGDIPAGGWRAFWVKRVVGANAVAVNDTFTVRYQGDTLP